MFSPLVAIFLIVLVDVLGFSIILPLLPFYAERYGASPATIGFLSASYAVCQLISGPYLGALSDRMGRKPLLVLSQVGTLAGFLILAFAPNLWFVFLGRIIDGLTAGNISLAQAFVSDVTAPEDRAKAFGKIGMAFGAGFLFGPALAGYLARYGYHAPMYAAAGLSATSILATMILLPRHERAKDDGPARRARILDVSLFRHYFRQPGLRVRLSQFFLFVLAFSLYTSGFALFASRRLFADGRPFGPTEVGYVFSFNGALNILVQGVLLGRLVKAFGEHRLAFAGFMAMALGYGILAMVSGIPGVLLAMVFAAWGSGMARPLLTSLVSRQVAARDQGKILGVNQSLQALGQTGAPIVGGFLIENGWLVAWALAATGASCMGAALNATAKDGAGEARDVTPR